MYLISKGSLVALAVAFTATGCGGGNPGPQPTSISTSTSSTVNVRDFPRRAVVKHSTGTIAIYSERGGDVVQHFNATTDLGSRRTFVVDQTTDAWVLVELPTRPAKGDKHPIPDTGWVKRSEVDLSTIHEHIAISLKSTTITFAQDGRILAMGRIAVGSTENPTPVGSYYITDLVQNPQPRVDYGPYALGTSALSPTITQFGTGNGQIGIHGTERYDSIGRRISHGCIRLDLRDKKLLSAIKQMTLGTLVIISND